MTSGGNKTSNRWPLLNQAGAVKSSTLIWLLLISLAIYVSYMILPPYFSYRMMKVEVVREAELAHKFPDDALLRNILEKANTWSVPLVSNDIIITRGFDSIDISVDYSSRVDFVPGYSKVLQFHIAVSRPIKESSGTLY